jgi:hypothetical protein
LQAGAGHAFAEAAFFEEILFEPADLLLVEEVVGLVDQANRKRAWNKTYRSYGTYGILFFEVALPSLLGVAQ